MATEWINGALKEMPKAEIDRQVSMAIPFIRKGIEAMNTAMLGWFIQIDLDQLDMSSLRWCVVGQVFNGWSMAPPGLIGDNSGRDRGFESSVYIGYPALTEAWEREINRLRKQWKKVGPHGNLAKIR